MLWFKLALAIGPLILAYIMFLFIYWGAYWWPGSWSVDARGVILFCFCVWLAIIAPFFFV